MELMNELDKQCECLQEGLEFHLKTLRLIRELQTRVVKAENQIIELRRERDYYRNMAGMEG